MTFYVSWSGLGRDLPPISDLARFAPHGAQVTHGQPVSFPGTDPAREHARHVGHLIEHWASEHPDERLSVSLSGHAQQIDTGVHSTLSLSLTTSPGQPAYASPFRFQTGGRIDQGFDPKERTVDVSQSHDPFAPEPETDPGASQESAVSAPADVDGGSDVSPDAAGSGAEDAPDPSPGVSPDSVSAGESDGPTEPGEAVNAQTGEVTAPGETLPDVDPSTSEPESEVQ